MTTQLKWKCSRSVANLACRSDNAWSRRSRGHSRRRHAISPRSCFGGGPLRTLLFQGNPSPDGRATPGRTLDLHLPAQQKHALPHAAKPEASVAVMLYGIKTDAVILDGELQSPVDAPEGNLRPARFRVPRNVVQCLLGNAKQAQRRIARQVVGNVGNVHLQPKRMHPRKTFEFGLQGLDQAEVFQDGGMQPIRQRMYVP